MTLLDVYYRALVDYRKITKESREATTYRAIAAKSGTDNDRIEILRAVCTIEEDWVNAIEEGLVYVEKAINEQRQFIQSNGEVMPIEKIKHVSKESVEHLAKHTNLVDKIPEEGERLIPSQLYSVEKFSDFAVYENKFLHLLLTYLRDFITIRYEKILELTNTYKGKLRIKKTISMQGNHIEFEASLDEFRMNDAYLIANNKSKDIIDRIKNCYNGVLALLATPLMEEVAKVAPIKPPITRTNVLKMNNNFKNALALYSFITSYDKDGYTIKDEPKVLSPFGDEAADEFADIELLLAFLTYQYGLDIKKVHKASYEKEEALRKEEEDLRHQEKIKAVKRHVKENGGDPDEYMLLLEQRNKSLENDHANLGAAMKNIAKLEEEAEELTEQIESLEEELDESQQELAQVTFNYSKELSDLKSGQATKIAQMEQAYKANIVSAVQKERQAVQSDLEHKDQVIEMMLQDKKEVDRVNSQKVQAINIKYQEKEQELQGKIRELNSLQEEFKHLKIKLDSLRSKQGLEEEIADYTTEEGFAQLEQEYAIFQEFFEKEWAKTKKAIRKKVLRKPKSELKAEIKQDKEQEKAQKAATAPPKKEKIKNKEIEEQDETIDFNKSSNNEEFMDLDDFMNGDNN